MSLAQRLNRGQMKKLFITSVAALLLATGTAHAGSFFENYASETDTCFVVTKTPDGFLAVRAKPDAKTELFAALRPGYPLIASPDSQFLEGDEVRRYKNWTKWVRVRGWFADEDAEPSFGWVYGKYLKKVPCTSQVPFVAPGQLPTVGNPNPK
jgi:hypothetical protein